MELPSPHSQPSWPPKSLSLSFCTLVTPVLASSRHHLVGAPGSSLNKEIAFLLASLPPEAPPGAALLTPAQRQHSVAPQLPSLRVPPPGIGYLPCSGTDPELTSFSGVQTIPCSYPVIHWHLHHVVVSTHRPSPVTSARFLQHWVQADPPSCTSEAHSRCPGSA